MLANIPEQQQSGDTASEDDIGEELQACLAGHEEAESAAVKPVSLRSRFAQTEVSCAAQKLPNHNDTSTKLVCNNRQILLTSNNLIFPKLLEGPQLLPEQRSTDVKQEVTTQNKSAKMNGRMACRTKQR